MESLITVSIPAWLVYLFLGYITIDIVITGIKVWYGWRLTRDQRVDRSTNDLAREAQLHKDGFDTGVKYAEHKMEKQHERRL